MTFQRLIFTGALVGMLAPLAGYAGTPPPSSPKPSLKFGVSGPYSGLKYVGSSSSGDPTRKQNACKGKKVAHGCKAYAKPVHLPK